MAKRGKKPCRKPYEAVTAEASGSWFAGERIQPREPDHPPPTAATGSTYRPPEPAGPPPVRHTSSVRLVPAPRARSEPPAAPISPPPERPGGRWRYALVWEAGSGAPPAPPPLPPPATPPPETQQVGAAQKEPAVVKKLESGRRVRSRTPLRRIAQKAKEIRAAKVASKPAPVVTVPKPSVSAGHQVLLETQQKIHEARDRVADLRLQYRALLEAFAPNNPPSESAKDFVDQLSLLNQRISELQEVEDHLRTRNLRESISAKTASGTEPPVTAKPSKVSTAEQEKGKRVASLAPTVPKTKKAKPASVPPAERVVKATPLTGSAGRSVSLAQQTPKSGPPVKPAPAPPVKAPPLRSSSVRSLPKPSAPVEVIEVPEGGRSSSPLPVRRATRAVETPVAASSVVVDPEEERPVIGLDYHNTIEFEHRVHP